MPETGFLCRVAILYNEKMPRFFEIRHFKGIFVVKMELGVG